MTSDALAGALAGLLGPSRVGVNVRLASMTTFRVGGPADVFVEPRSAREVTDVLALAHRMGAPVTMLGGGSNVLVGDGGVRGVVVRPRLTSIELSSPGRVRAEAGVTINGLVRWLIVRGLAGLEAWAGTPGTVGGAIHGNAHFGGRQIGERIDGVRLVDQTGVARDVAAEHMDFGYDRSRLQRSHDVLLWAVFRVGEGDPAALRAVARQSLAFRKRTQPLESRSAGCVFQNPDSSVDAVPEGIPASAGALVDRAGLKGHAIGHARVSTTHANFIVNEGGATAADIRSLIELCRKTVAETFGVELRTEIVYLGDFLSPEP
jgi:UDP-N-acetylmuramate dehydrogenase